MTDGGKQEIENYRNTFKARAKGKLKKWYIEGHGARSLDTVANQFREEAETIFSGDDLDKHLEYVKLLVDASKKAVEESPVDLDDPDVLFNRDVSIEDIKRDGDHFERAIDDIREQREDENA